MVASCQAISLFSQNLAFNQKVGDHHHHHHRCCHRRHGHYDRRSSNDNFTSLIRFSSISHVSSSSSSYPLSSPAAFSVPLFATTPRFAIICSFMLQNLSNSCFHRDSPSSPHFPILLRSASSSDFDTISYQSASMTGAWPVWTLAARTVWTS